MNKEDSYFNKAMNAIWNIISFPFVFFFELLPLIIYLVITAFSIWFIYLMVKVMLKYLAS